MTSQALVLGGGGNTGFAWQWGVLTGLRRAGVDLAGADVLIGTSGGAAAAVELLSGRDPDELLDVLLKPAPKPGQPGAETRSGAGYGQTLRRLLGEFADGARIRTELARYARSAVSQSQDDFKRGVARYMRIREWPTGTVLMAAVDADTGEVVTFSRESGVPMIDALAASCSLPGMCPPVTINGRDYLDGTVFSPTNAALAAGNDRVVVLAPVPGTRGMPGASLAEQIAPVEAEGRVVVVTPSDEARQAMGKEMMDNDRRPAVTRIAIEHGTALADQLGTFWRT